MNQKIGTCSLCGGDVMAHQGGWWSILPPPPPTCSCCGAVSAASQGPVIPMVRKGQFSGWESSVTGGIGTKDNTTSW